MTTRSASALCSALVLSTLVACGAAPPPPEIEPAPAAAPDPCNFEKQAQGVWNQKVRGRLAIPLKILQGNLEAQEAEMLTANLDLFAADWRSMRESVCRKHLVEQTLGQADYEAEVACLDSALEVQRDIIVAVEAEDESVVDEIRVLSQALERCKSTDREAESEIRSNPFEKKSSR
jgi:hypothetical protein